MTLLYAIRKENLKKVENKGAVPKLQAKKNYTNEIFAFLNCVYKNIIFENIESFDFEMQEKRVKKLNEYFVTHIDTPEDNILSLYAFALFYCITDNSLINNEKTLSDILCKIEPFKTKLPSIYRKYFWDEKCDVIINVIIDFIQEIVERKWTSEGIYKPKKSRNDYFKLRLFFRDVLNEVIYAWIEQELSRELLDKYKINNQNFEVLLKFPWIDCFGIINVFEILEKELITTNKDIETKRGKSNNTLRVTKTKEDRDLMFKLFCGFFLNDRNRYETFRPSVVLKIFNEIQNNLFGYVYIDMKDKKYDFAKTSTAYNCNMLMIMVFCMNSYKSHTPGHDVLRNQISIKNIKEISRIHRERYVRKLNDYEKIYNFVKSSYYLPLRVVLLSKRYFDERCSKEDISMTTIYIDYWKKEKIITMNNGGRRTLKDLFYDNLLREI